MSPIQDSKGVITPSSLHFVRAHGHAPPDIDPQQHRLLIHGMVDRPMIFTMEELQRLPSVSRIHFLECSGNSEFAGAVGFLGAPRNVRLPETVQQTHGLTSCSEWTGVLLSLLLQEAGVQEGASWIVAEGADPPKHSMSIPMEKAMDDTIVAYSQNGEPLRPEQGFPLRMLYPGFIGNRNVKWVRRIKVGDEPFMTNQESQYREASPDGQAHWFDLVQPPRSVITFPSGGQRLSTSGFYEVTGLAWSGGGAIRRVEVSTDGGRTWKDARLQEPVYRMAHTRFHFPWNWDGEEALLQSRCTDELGQVQPSLAELGKIWGLTMEDFRRTGQGRGRSNYIQPWKVMRDGSVHNAIYMS